MFHNLQHSARFHLSKLQVQPIEKECLDKTFNSYDSNFVEGQIKITAFGQTRE